MALKPLSIKTKKMEDVRSDVPTAAAAKGELVRVNLLVAPSVRTAWRMKALNDGTTMQQLIIDAMNLYFTTSKK